MLLLRGIPCLGNLLLLFAVSAFRITLVALAQAKVFASQRLHILFLSAVCVDCIPQPYKPLPGNIWVDGGGLRWNVAGSAADVCGCNQTVCGLLTVQMRSVGFASVRNGRERLWAIALIVAQYCGGDDHDGGKDLTVGLLQTSSRSFFGKIMSVPTGF